MSTPSAWGTSYDYPPARSQVDDGLAVHVHLQGGTGHHGLAISWASPWLAPVAQWRGVVSRGLARLGLRDRPRGVREVVQAGGVAMKAWLVLTLWVLGPWLLVETLRAYGL